MLRPPDLRFHNYGLEMLEGLDRSKPLKPGGIGTHVPIKTGTKVSWRDVEIAIKVKGTWGNLIAQGATYARCLFAARETRHFALVVAFNHQSFEVRFCFFRRDGLWASKAFDLRQEDGLKTFVRAVAGLLSWSNVSEVGMDPSRSDRQFFNADRCLDITDVVCYHIWNVPFSVPQEPLKCLGVPRFLRGTAIQGTALPTLPEQSALSSKEL